MNTTAFSILLVHLVINILLIFSCLFCFDLLKIDFISEFFETVMMILFTCNIVLLLFRLRKTSGYKQTYFKSFTAAMLVFILTAIGFKFIASYYHGIDLHWEFSLNEYGYLLIRFLIISVITSFFFRTSKTEIESNQKVVH